MPPDRGKLNLQNLTLWHTGIFAVATAWMFGGKIYWAELPLSMWGTIGAGLTVAGFVQRVRTDGNISRPLLWLSPFFVLMALILTSALNPSFEIIDYFGSQVHRPREPLPWLPSGAVPADSLNEAWLFGGLYLAAFNLTINISSLRRLRWLLLGLALNAVAIAIFGTLQKLTGQDMFFGLQKSPNPTFFGSFIYHNHWGAYAVLSLTLCLGAAAWLMHHHDGRGFWHSPAVGVLLGAALIVVAVPLSTSRSSTAMVVLVTVGTALFESRRLLRRTSKRRRHGGDRLKHVAILAGAVGFTLAAMYWLAAPILAKRMETTRQQVAAMVEQGSIGERETLYAETWAIFEKKPWFGWGFESWELIFRRTTSLTHRGDGIPIYFDQAHSDWLQSLAETGIVGTTLLLLMVILPLWSTRRHLRGDTTVAYLLAGNALIAAYAWIEFPLANPAVVITWWITFFGALRYAQITQD